MAHIYASFNDTFVHVSPILGKLEEGKSSLCVSRGVDGEQNSQTDSQSTG